jgi:copper resistance protein B
MSTFRTLALAAGFIAYEAAAAAQTPGKEEPTLGMDMQPVMDRGIFAHAILNEFEGRFNGSNPEFRWDGQGWVGTDYDKLWIKSEGTLQSNGTLDDGQQQFLYSRAITTYFDLQGGLRSDLDSRPTRNWAAFGIQGLAPYFFDLDLTGYASGQDHLAAKLEASYDLLITQRLILQPQIELNLYSKADPARLVGAGFSDIDTGLRLRYEFSRKLAPYLGVVYEGRFGQSASYARRLGESTGDSASLSASGCGFERPACDVSSPQS